MKERAWNYYCWFADRVWIGLAVWAVVVLVGGSVWTGLFVAAMSGISFALTTLRRRWDAEAKAIDAEIARVQGEIAVLEAAQTVRDAVPPEDWARVREIRDGAVMTDRREAALTRVLEAFGEES